MPDVVSLWSVLSLLKLWTLLCFVSPPKSPLREESSGQCPTGDLHSYPLKREEIHFYLLTQEKSFGPSFSVNLLDLKMPAYTHFIRSNYPPLISVSMALLQRALGRTLALNSLIPFITHRNMELLCSLCTRKVFIKI